MVIHQLHSIGDLLFLEPMYRHFWEKEGVKPIVPVRDHLMWLAYHIDSAQFVPESEMRKLSGLPFLDTMHANQRVRKLPLHDHSDFENCMLDKYVLAGLEPMLWKKMQYSWLIEKSVKVMHHFDITPDSLYILVNEYSQAGKININVDDSPLRVIRMETLPGFTVMDWYMVMKFAQEIHTVSTSLFYIMQHMNDFTAKTNDKIHIYPRPNIDGLRGISKLNPDFHYHAMQ